MSASTWQDAHEPVPFPESLASIEESAALLHQFGVGSVPTGISLDSAIWDVLMIEIVSASRSREYSVSAAALSANPLGPRLFLGSAFEPEPLGSGDFDKGENISVRIHLGNAVGPEGRHVHETPAGIETMAVGCAKAVLSAGDSEGSDN